MKTWEEMTSKEKDEAVARILEWTGEQEETFWPNMEWVWRNKHGGKIYNDGAALHSDWQIARMLERRIVERGLQWEYLKALHQIVNKQEFDGHGMLWYIRTQDIFSLLHTPPEQRCHAAWLAVREEKTDE